MVLTMCVTSVERGSDNVVEQHVYKPLVKIEGSDKVDTLLIIAAEGKSLSTEGMRI